MELDRFPRWARANKMGFNSLGCKAVQGWGWAGGWAGVGSVGGPTGGSGGGKGGCHLPGWARTGQHLPGEVLGQMNPSS